MNKAPNTPILEEETHTYTLGGHVLPSVSEIMRPIVSFDGIPEDVLTKARIRGKAIHKALEYYDQGDLDHAQLSPVIVPYVEAYEKFIRDTGFKPHYIEKIVWSSIYRYAGTLDRSGTLFDNHAVIDLKAVHELNPATAIQTAAYDKGLCESEGEEKHKRYGLQLKKDGTYRLQEYTDPHDFQVFLSLLNIYYWRKRNGK